MFIVDTTELSNGERSERTNLIPIGLTTEAQIFEILY